MCDAREPRALEGDRELVELLAQLLRRRVAAGHRARLLGEERAGASQSHPDRPEALQVLRWQVATFGFHLASLEVRQHADVHRAALEKLERLEPGADTARVAAILDADVSPGVTVGEVIATFRAIASIQRRRGEEACSRVVVSFTSGPADVLAVLDLAARAADPAIGAVATSGIGPGSPAVDVVPLFEIRGCPSRVRRHRGRAAARRAVPGAPRSARWPAGGDARLLGLEQGVRPGGGALAAVPRPGAPRRGRAAPWS